MPYILFYSLYFYDMPTRIVRSWTEAQKRECAAKQGWKCGHCGKLLPSSFEVDHIVPLWKRIPGSEDIETNGVALDSNCHSRKTQREWIERMTERRALAAEEHAKKEFLWEKMRRGELDREIRQFTMPDGTKQCSKCKKKYYPIFTHRCWLVEATIASELKKRSQPIIKKRIHQITPRNSARAPEDAWDRFLL